MHNLSGADLEGADLKYAKLDGVTNLDKTNWTMAKDVSATVLVKPLAVFEKQKEKKQKKLAATWLAGAFGFKLGDKTDIDPLNPKDCKQIKLVDYFGRYYAFKNPTEEDLGLTCKIKAKKPIKLFSTYAIGIEPKTGTIFKINGIAGKKRFKKTKQAEQYCLDKINLVAKAIQKKYVTGDTKDLVDIQTNKWGYASTDFTMGNKRITQVCYVDSGIPTEENMKQAGKTESMWGSLNNGETHALFHIFYKDVAQEKIAYANAKVIKSQQKDSAVSELSEEL
mgnify:CR=1 FL=1